MLDLKVKQFIIATVIGGILSYFHFYLLGFFFWTFGFVVFEDSLDVTEDGDDIFEFSLIDSINNFDELEFRTQLKGYRIDDFKNKKLILDYYWQNRKIIKPRYWDFTELLGGEIDLDDNISFNATMDFALKDILLKKKRLKKNKYFF